MAKKENKGGLLSNEQIENELERASDNDKAGRGYRGIQDTGEETVRDMGTQVQQSNGHPLKENEESRDI